MRLVVVVLPWLPETAMACRKRMSSPSISARCTTGLRAARAISTSGLSSATAPDTTTTSASPTFSARWPMCTRAPSRVRRRVTADSFRSEPCTA